MTVLCGIMLFQKIPIEEHYGSNFTYEIVERALGTDSWALVESLPSDKLSFSYTPRSDSVELAIISNNEIGSALPSSVFRISSADLGQFCSLLVFTRFFC